MNISRLGRTGRMVRWLKTKQEHMVQEEWANGMGLEWYGSRMKEGANGPDGRRFQLNGDWTGELC